MYTISNFQKQIRNTPIVAINGCNNIAPLSLFLTLAKGYQIKELELNTLLMNYNGKLKNYLMGLNKENFNKNLIIINSSGNVSDALLKLFQQAADRENFRENLTDINSKIIIAGDWSEKEIIEQLKTLQISYHFSEGSSLFYMMDLRFDFSDFDHLNDRCGFNDPSTWSTLIDFTNGELNASHFLSQIFTDVDSNYMLCEMAERGCDEYFNKYERRNMKENLLEFVKDVKHVHSIKTVPGTLKYELIKRSNLFDNVG